MVWYSHNGERIGTYEGHNGTVWRSVVSGVRRVWWECGAARGSGGGGRIAPRPVAVPAEWARWFGCGAMWPPHIVARPTPTRALALLRNLSFCTSRVQCLCQPRDTHPSTWVDIRLSGRRRQNSRKPLRHANAQFRCRTHSPTHDVSRPVVNVCLAASTRRTTPAA